MDKTDAENTDDAVRDHEVKDSSTRSETGSGAGYGPPATGERGDPQRDPESKVPRDPVESEPGDIDSTDDPNMGKESRGS